LTTALQCIKSPKKPYTLAGFEPGIFCSEGGRDDHYATPPGQEVFFIITEMAHIIGLLISTAKVVY
jgi:hypothetical protein